MSRPEFVPFKQNTHGPEDDDGPVTDWRLQKPFGAGLKRKRVRFVPASTNTTPPITSTAPKTRKLTGAEAAIRYLTLVGLHPLPSTCPVETCPDCKLQITDGDTETHKRSTAHQASLEHSHPPHHYDRSSMGLKMLAEAGWDPDARVGLGARGEGIRWPVKAVVKVGKEGVGRKIMKEEAGIMKVKKNVGVKEARREEKERKERKRRLMGELGGGVDVEALLNAKME